MSLTENLPAPGTLAPVNLGYLATIGNVKFFHTGDWQPARAGLSYLQTLGRPAEAIDVAFIDYFVLSSAGSQPLVLDGIRPRHIVAMHLEYFDAPPDFGLISSYFPNAVLFRNELESWVMPQG